MPWSYHDTGDLLKQIDTNAPIVKKLVTQATRQLRIRTGRSTEAFLPDPPTDAVRAAAWALYEEILGSTPTIDFSDIPSSDRDGVQQVRTLQEIASERKMNCLEAALLYSSCALLANLNPVLIERDGGKLDHALVGIWLSGQSRNLHLQRDGTLLPGTLLQLVGTDRFDNSRDYWDHFSRASMLVIDCSGAANGYPNIDGMIGLNFENAVEYAWKPLQLQKESQVHLAIDLRQACGRSPFPNRSRTEIFGRDVEFEHISNHAEKNNIIIWGTFGVGKTALALEYAFRNRNKYPGGIFLLNASDETRIADQLVDFARQCDIKPTVPDTSESLELIVLWRYRINNAGSKALLIIDDVHNPTFLEEEFLNSMSLSQFNCRLLITTRHEDLLTTINDFYNQPLYPLDNEDAIDLLLSLLPQDRRDRTGAKRLCELLKNLPLLIRIAGLTVSRDRSITLNAYADMVEAGYIPSDESSLPDDYPESVDSVLGRAWDNLDQRIAGPQYVLRLVSLLPSNESIPFELLALLLDTGDNSHYQERRLAMVQRAFGELSDIGLAEKSEDDAIRLHPVVHVFAKLKDKEDPEFYDQSLQLIVERLHQPEFYLYRNSNELVGRITQLKLLRDSSNQCEKLRKLLDIYDNQIEHLRQGFDPLQQLALQASLSGADDLAKNLMRARSQEKGAWFRLRWYGKHKSKRREGTEGHSDAVSAVAIWPAELQEEHQQIAVSGAENGELILWSLNPLKPLRPITNIGASISGLCISEDGTNVYVSARDGSVRTLSINPDNFGIEKIIERHAYPVNDCAIDPKGAFLACVLDDGTAWVYALSKGNLLQTINNPRDTSLSNCAIARQTDKEIPLLLTVSISGVARIWNPLNGEELEKIQINTSNNLPMQVSSCALTADSKWAAIATQSGVLLWKPSSKATTTKMINESYITDCAFSPDGSRIMLVGRNKQPIIYRIEPLGMEKRLNRWYHWLTTCTFGAGGRLFYASDDGSVHTLEYNSRNSESTELNSVQGHPNWVNVFRAGKEKALSVSTDLSIYSWSLEIGNPQPRMQGHANWVNAFAVSPDGKHILAGTDLGNIEYWSIVDDSRTAILKGFSQRANACEISADGNIGLVGSEDSTLRSWALYGSFDRLMHFSGEHRGAVKTCAISEDGKRAISGGDDGRAVLWNLDDGNCLRVFNGHKTRITAVDFVPDQVDWVVTASWDHTVKCWSIEFGEEIKTYEGHTDSVTSCGVSRNNIVYSVSLDRTLQRWSLTDEESPITIHLSQRMRGLVVDPSGDMLVCSDMTGMVFSFDVEPGSRDVLAS